MTNYQLWTWLSNKNAGDVKSAGNLWFYTQGSFNRECSRVNLTSIFVDKSTWRFVTTLTECTAKTIRYHIHNCLFGYLSLLSSQLNPGELCWQREKAAKNICQRNVAGILWNSEVYCRQCVMSQPLSAMCHRGNVKSSQSKLKDHCITRS